MCAALSSDLFVPRLSESAIHVEGRVTPYLILGSEVATHTCGRAFFWVILYPVKERLKMDHYTTPALVTSG